MILTETDLIQLIHKNQHLFHPGCFRTNRIPIRNQKIIQISSDQQLNKNLKSQVKRYHIDNDRVDDSIRKNYDSIDGEKQNIIKNVNNQSYSFLNQSKLGQKQSQRRYSQSRRNIFNRNNLLNQSIQNQLQKNNEKIMISQRHNQNNLNILSNKQSQRRTSVENRREDSVKRRKRIFSYQLNQTKQTNPKIHRNININLNKRDEQKQKQQSQHNYLNLHKQIELSELNHELLNKKMQTVTPHVVKKQKNSIRNKTKYELLKSLKSSIDNDFLPSPQQLQNMLNSVVPSPQQLNNIVYNKNLQPYHQKKSIKSTNRSSIKVQQFRSQNHIIQHRIISHQPIMFANRNPQINYCFNGNPIIPQFTNNHIPFQYHNNNINMEQGYETTFRQGSMQMSRNSNNTSINNQQQQKRINQLIRYRQATVQ